MTNVVELIKSDHRAVEALFHEYKNGHGDKGHLVDEICNELEKHADTEEKVVYPHLPEDQSKHATEEHQDIRDVIARLKTSTDVFDNDVEQLEAVVSHHVGEEEGPGGILEWLQKNLADDLDSLGLEFERTKQTI